MSTSAGRVGCGSHTRDQSSTDRRIATRHSRRPPRGAQAERADCRPRRIGDQPIKNVLHRVLQST